MKKFIYFIIIAALIGLAPIISYEKEVTSGVTAIEQKSIAAWAYEKYQEIQEKKAVNDAQ